MTRKKILLVIVEGTSDETALGYAMTQVYDKEQVYIQVVHGDVTTRDRVTSSNIVNKVGDEVKKFMDNNPFKPSDFKGIIHIVDMDGAYAPDSAIVEDKDCRECVYSETQIRTNSVEKIIKRNQQKKENLLRLIGNGRIGIIRERLDKIDYQLKNELILVKDEEMLALEIADAKKLISRIKLENNSIYYKQLINELVNILDELRYLWRRDLKLDIELLKTIQNPQQDFYLRMWLPDFSIEMLRNIVDS